MRSQMLVLVVMSLCALAPACPPSPQPPQPPDVVEDAGADEEGRRPSTPATACSNLAAVGCAEGRATDCVVTIEKAVAARITRIDLACLTTKKTKAEIRACGFVSCK